KPAAAKPAFVAPLAPPPPKAAAPEMPMIDLPAPKPALPKPPFGAPLAPPPPKAAAPEPPMIDLPAPKPTAAKPAFGAPLAPPVPQADEPLIDLPGPVRDKVGVMPKPPGAAALAPDMPLIDLPGVKQVDLPAVKKGATAFGFGEVDLPTPKGSVDLPAPKPSPASIGEMDLPAPKTIADLPAPRGIADLPAPLGVTDLPSPQRGGFGELDLPIPKAFAPLGDEEASFGSLELPSGPPGRPDSSDFGDIELPPPRAAADLVPPKARTFQGVGVPGRAEDETSFGNLELGSPIPPYPDDEMRLDDVRSDDLLKLKSDGNSMPAMDLGSLPPALRGGPPDGDVDAYGEAGLDATDESMEFGIADAEGEGFALPPEILRRQRGEDVDATPVDKSKRALHVLLGVALLLVVVGGAGAALGFTDYGFFGIYVLEQYLPEAGSPKFAREAIERAEKSAAPDTYKGVRSSLVVLGEARRNAGLNRELLTRSLLHESLYLVRFGADTGSSAHVAAIMRRLEERHGIAPGMALARAADAARRGDYKEAEARLRDALGQTPNDAYAHLLAGEVAMHQAKLAEAEKAFRQALKHGGSARAQWGLARVALARPDEAAQQSAIEETLKLSPMHAEARIAESRVLFQQGKEERAVLGLRQALGLEPIDDQFLQSSKLAKAQGHSLLGHIHEQRGRLHLARKAYEDALAADPYLIEALLGSGRVLLRERRFNDALARFESGLNIAAKSPSSVVLSGRKAEDEARLGQARAELAVGRSQEAKANLTKLATANPNDSEVTLAMGQAEEAIGNRESAENLFRKAIELAPTSFAGYLALSQYFFKQNQPDKASETLNDAAGKVEENAEMRRMLGQSELARNRLDSAVHEFKRAIELDPQDLEARFGLAISLRRSNELEQARTLFDGIAQRDPQYAGLTLERGQLLEAQGEYDKAIESYRAALEKDPEDNALNLRLGAAQVEGGKLDDAEQTLDKVIHRIPNSADAEYYIGRVAFARGRGPDALTHFDRALALDITQAAYHLYAARAALEMNNLGRTIEEAEAALARDAKLGDAYWVRGVVRLRSGAVKDALKDAARALELKPGRIEAHALMAECYDELRQLPQSIEAYQIALSHDANRGEWWYKLGRVYLDKGARNEGENALERAIKLGDALDPPPYWLADSYRLIGENARNSNRKLAMAAYKKYLQLAPHGALDRADVLKLMRSWNVELDQ
ncbi:MAG TPA: tetratricopeptide repeat protein, partial [Polyangiales bacterium]|nr:tetratricopeptide repeat protein [Polyangiales bacterium]